MALLPRATRLAGLPAAAIRDRVVGRAAVLRGADPDQVARHQRAASAQRLRSTLGDLKGGALKAGQVLSTVQVLFPADPERTWAEALTSLQEQVDALPFDEVEPVLVTELGPGWRRRFGSFDTTAAAAASIGQVHRATTLQGQPLAVKIQYPEVAEALSADLALVSAMTRVAAAVAPRASLPPLVAELRTRLTEELDYRTEAGYQRAFAQAYGEGGPHRREAVVPGVLHATRQVLVQEWLDGEPLASLADHPDPARRADAALRYQRFLLSGPARCGVLHTDPHPGNFRVLPDGRLGVLDFGSALRLPHGLPSTFGRLIRVLGTDDPDQVAAGLRDGGFLRPGSAVDVRALMDVLAPFAEPSRHDTFHYHPAWLRAQFGRVNDPRNPDFAAATRLTLPAEHLFTHRVWLGIVGVLCMLDVTIPVRAELERWLPGFAETAAA
jgi:predicted unusual protein kinase regulating ubiquinone biosynthesis (AarF/ABC1/UbiB family)